MHRILTARRHGFTLVEAFSTLAVVGTLAAFAIPRFVDTTGFESRGFYDRAQNVVRHAQKIAIAQRRSLPATPVYVVVSANAMQVCYDSACTSPVTDAASGQPLAITTPNAVTLSPVTTFSFDGGGAPSVGSRLALNVNSSGAGDINRTFYVEATTGYVHE